MVQHLGIQKALYRDCWSLKYQLLFIWLHDHYQEHRRQSTTVNNNPCSSGSSTSRHDIYSTLSSIPPHRSNCLAPLKHNFNMSDDCRFGNVLHLLIVKTHVSLCMRIFNGFISFMKTYKNSS